MYCLIEFKEEDGGGLSVVRDTWLTPRKKQVFWPPYKDTAQFRKALTKPEEVNAETWKLYDIHRTFYECDDYEKACNKLKRAEITSDIQSEVDEIPIKRKRFPTRRLSFSDTDEEGTSNKYPRPPPIKKSTPASTTALVIENPHTRASSSSQPSCSFTPRSSEMPTGFDKAAYETLTKYILMVKEQNTQILSLLQKKTVDVPQTSLPLDLPVNFPLRSEQELTSLENYLHNKENLNILIAYFSKKGASNELVTTVNRTLKFVISNSLACQFSYFGKRTKKAFRELNLNELIIGSVTISCPGCTQKQVEDAIKVWLKHANNRLKISDKNRSTDD